MRKTILALLIVIISISSSPAAAQTSGPIYIVQPGDTLSSIAVRFNITVAQLMEANGISDPNLLAAGQQVIIPGLEGISGILDTKIVGFGDNLRGLTRSTQVPLHLLKRLNRIVSPSELYVGVSLIIPQSDTAKTYTARAAAHNGESMLELAVRQNTDIWTLATVNDLSAPIAGLPGDALYYPGESSANTPGGFPSAILSAEVKTLPLKQGGTAQILIQAQNGTSLGGMFLDHSLHFFVLPDGRLAALQGVHAMLEPGAYPLRIDMTLPDGSLQSYEQMVLVKSTGFAEESLTVDPATLDPAVIEPELQRIVDVVAPITPQRYWQNPFALPVDPQYCVRGFYGLRRTYNGGTYFGFHSGLDFGICSDAHPFDIYAPAPGVVVFAENLFVRGNATIIDHGEGVYTGYWHQDEIYVKVGDFVNAGQLIGKIGSTGRVTGPHLHWEIWVNGVQVQPLDWLFVLIPE